MIQDMTTGGKSASCVSSPFLLWIYKKLSICEMPLQSVRVHPFFNCRLIVRGNSLVMTKLRF